MTDPLHHPLQQGDLDQLCGVYCLVNTVRYLCGPLDEKETRRLFEQILGYLHRRRCVIERMAKHGVTLLELVTVLRDILWPCYGVRRYKPFRQHRGVTFDLYWERVQGFLQSRHGIVLSRIDGQHDHWTLIRDANHKQLRLYDSDGLKQLKRKHCRLCDDTPRRRYILYPTQTYFLWVD